MIDYLAANPAPLSSTSGTGHVVAAVSFLGSGLTLRTVFDAKSRAKSPKSKLRFLLIDKTSASMFELIAFSASNSIASLALESFTFVDQRCTLSLRTENQVFVGVFQKSIFVSDVLCKVLLAQYLLA